MENSDETSEVSRGLGRLALALIPWALGLGLATWAGVYFSIHDFHQQVKQEQHVESQQQRAATYVGAAERPKSRIVISVIPHDCSHVTRADVDGTDLLIYAKNDCHHTLDYLAWHWTEISPDGTVLHDDYTNWACPSALMAGDKAECRVHLEGDDRDMTVRVWTSIEP